MSLGSKSEINNFILEGRSKILLTLEHDIIGIMMDTNRRFYSYLKQLCKKVAKNLLHWPELSPILIKNKLLSPNSDFLFQAFTQSYQETARKIVKSSL